MTRTTPTATPTYSALELRADRIHRNHRRMRRLLRRVARRSDAR